MRKFLIVLLFICTLFLCFVIPSFAEDGVTPLADVPTDLTGYTVTVPAGWTAMRAYTTLELNCSFDNTVVSDTANPLTIKVGYSKNGSSYADSIQIINPYTEASYGLGNSYPITFVIGEGFQSNSTIFIQWLVDNNASFTSSEPEPEPFVVIPAGRYYFNASLEYPSITDIFDGNSTLSFSCDGFYIVGSLPYHFNTFIFELDSYLDDENYRVYVSVVNDYGTSVRIYEIAFMNGLVVLGYPEVEISYLEFPEDTLVDSNISILFNEYFSFYPVQPPPFEGNPWTYILEMVIEALKVKIWGYFSVWDIVTTLCGIFIATWLLKLLAGG